MECNYYIDTHTHIYGQEFSGEYDLAVERAKAAGVKKVITPGIDSSCHGLLLDFCEKHSGFAFPAAGLHPTSVNGDWEKELDFVYSELSTGKYVAVGEIGIDAYWSKEYLGQQKEAFRLQLQKAAEMGLPVIIHAREATEPILQILKSLKHLAIKGVFHAYTGSYETSRIIKDLGDFKFGIGGVVTFKNASIAETVKKLDLKDIVLETDSPYLTPAPLRGKRNESSYIPLIAEKISSLKNAEIEEIASVTTENAETLFNI